MMESTPRKQTQLEISSVTPFLLDSLRKATIFSWICSYSFCWNHNWPGLTTISATDWCLALCLFPRRQNQGHLLRWKESYCMDLGEVFEASIYRRCQGGRKLGTLVSGQWKVIEAQGTADLTGRKKKVEGWSPTGGPVVQLPCYENSKMSNEAAAMGCLWCA